jgi:hypothetical protein
MKRALCWALTVPCILVTGPLGAAVGELKPVPIDAKTMGGAGFGPKRLPTPEELDLINRVHRGAQ